MFSNMLGNLVLFVKKAYEKKVDEIPTAALLTGINMPDHEEQFKALAREIRMQVSPHVACLNSLSCPSVKQIVENVVDAFVNDAGSGVRSAVLCCFVEFFMCSLLGVVG